MQKQINPVLKRESHVGTSLVFSSSPCLTISHFWSVVSVAADQIVNEHCRFVSLEIAGGKEARNRSGSVFASLPEYFKSRRKDVTKLSLQFNMLHIVSLEISNLNCFWLFGHWFLTVRHNTLFTHNLRNLWNRLSCFLFNCFLYSLLCWWLFEGHTSLCC